MSMLNLNLDYIEQPSQSQIFFANLKGRWLAWLRRPRSFVLDPSYPGPSAYEIRHKICVRAQAEIEREQRN